jgi:hypothetical protein
MALIETLSQPYIRARSVNQTSTSFVSKVPTLTEPLGDAGTATGASVLDLVGGGASGGGGVFVQNGAVIVPYGTGSDGNTFSIRILSWKSYGLGAGKIWVPILLAELLCTLSSGNPGVGSLITSSMLFAKTITITTGNAGVSIDVISPAASAILASAMLDLKGVSRLELSFSTGSSATDCNALISLL